MNTDPSDDVLRAVYLLGLASGLSSGYVAHRGTIDPPAAAEISAADRYASRMIQAVQADPLLRLAIENAIASAVANPTGPLTHSKGMKVELP